MTAYIIRRILWLIPVLWAVATITFILMHVVPGGPFTQDKALPESIIDALNRRYNLDEPLWKQYLTYLWNILHGDLGLSFRGDRDVSELIRDGFFVTAQLGILAFIVAAVVGTDAGCPLGAEPERLAGLRRRLLRDRRAPACPTSYWPPS